jgi:hypothetical protein
MNHKIKTKDGVEEVNLTPLRAIRFKCLDCCCWQTKDVKDCGIQDCSLYPFRLGRNPNVKSRGQKGNSNSLQEYRDKKKSLVPDLAIFNKREKGIG